MTHAFHSSSLVGYTFSLQLALFVAYVHKYLLHTQMMVCLSSAYTLDTNSTTLNTGAGVIKGGNISS